MTLKMMVNFTDLEAIVTPRAPRQPAGAAVCLAFLISATAVLLASSGCASFSPDGGFDTVARLTEQRIGQTPSMQKGGQPTDAVMQRLAELVGQPLTDRSAVEIALLSHRGLQASYAELGIAEADLIRAGRLANPSIRFGRLSGNGVAEINRAVLFDVLGLFTMPMARQIEQGRFEQAQLRAAVETVGLAADARRAYFEAVTAQQLVGYFAQVKDAADASSELARRMVAAGNFSKLSQMREQSFYADATAQLARARHRSLAARERLSRLLALNGDALAFTLPDRLPDLPEHPLEPKDAEQAALAQRLDVLMAVHEAKSTAESLGLTRATRFINVLNLGVQTKSVTGEPLSSGYEIELELPLFDFGSVRAARAEARYMQAVHRAAQVAIDARSEVREAYSAYRTAYDLARHYRDEVVPLRQRISEENLLRYNGMLASVFDLLADSREQVASVVAAVESLRDCWIAETDLQEALSASSPQASPRNSLQKAPSGPASAH